MVPFSFFRKEVTPSPLHEYIDVHKFSTDFSFDILYDETIKEFIDKCVKTMRTEPGVAEPFLRDLMVILQQSEVNIPKAKSVLTVIYSIVNITFDIDFFDNGFVFQRLINYDSLQFD